MNLNTVLTRYYFKSCLLLFFVGMIVGGCNNKTQEEIKEERINAMKKQFENRLNNVKDSALKEVIRDNMMAYVFANLDDFFSDDKPFDGASEYETNPYKIAEYYETNREFFDNYKNTLTLSPSVFDRFELNAALANPFNKAITWQSLVAKDGKVFPILEENEVDTLSNNPQVYKDESFGEIKIWSKSDGFATSDDAFKKFSNTIQGARILIKSSLPQKVNKLIFAKNESGTTKKLDSVEIKLVSVNRNKIHLKILNKRKDDSALPDNSEWYEVFAKDKTGEYLHSRSSSSYAEDSKLYWKKKIEMLFKEKNYNKEVQAKYDKMEETFSAKEHYITYEAAYKGYADSIEIVLPDYTHTDVIQDTLLVPLVREKDTAYYRNTKALVYSNEQEYFESDFEMNPENADKEIIAADGNALMETEPYIRFEFPEKYLSNRFISIFDRMEDVKDLKAYDYGFFGFFKKEIVIEDTKNKKSQPSDEDDESFSQRSDKYYEFNTNWLKFDRKKLAPHEPRYITGTIPVHLAYIAKNKYTIGQMPEGITVSGNHVVVGQSYTDGKGMILQAKDERGHLLKRIDGASGNNHNSEIDYAGEYFFYGIPSEIIVYRNKGDNLVEFHFEKKMSKAKKKNDG